MADQPRVGIVMGSDSDWPVMEAAATALEEFDVAHEADVDLTLDDFVRVGSKVPHLADVKPFGQYVMTDVDRVGGVPVVMRALLDAGLLHGDTLTVTGRTMAENLADIRPPDVDGKVVRALAECNEVLTLLRKENPYAELYVDLTKRCSAIIDSASRSRAASSSAGHGNSARGRQQ